VTLLVQGRAITARDCHLMAALACGGHLNPAYFQLLNLDLSELLWHCEIVGEAQAAIAKATKEKARKDDPREAIAGVDMDWEPVP
jgi:hypothetical protein